MLAVLVALSQDKPPKNIGLQTKPPKRATVLFDGKSLDQWVRAGSSAPAGWKVADGVAEVVPGSGSIASKASLGSGHYHVEFNVPLMADKTSQARGNSGFYLLARYETQILDSVDNPTYATGGCGGIYGLKDPDSNEAKKPGEWQCYDSFFVAPTLGADGKIAKPGVLTVYWNGVLVHNKVELTEKADQSKDSAPVAQGPVLLQDHGCKVRFRNIWFQPTGTR